MRRLRFPPRLLHRYESRPSPASGEVADKTMTDVCGQSIDEDTVINWHPMANNVFTRTTYDVIVKQSINRMKFCLMGLVYYKLHNVQVCHTVVAYVKI